MEPKREAARLAYVFGMVLSVAIILAITTVNLASTRLVIDLPSSTSAFVLRRSISFLPPTLDAPQRARYRRYKSVVGRHSGGTDGM